MLLAWCAAFEGAPEEYDITVHDTAGSESAAISKAAAELVAKVLHCESHKQHHDGASQCACETVMCCCVLAQFLHA